MSEHRYPKRGLVADYVRAGAGLAMTAGPLLAVPVGGVVAGLLGGCAVLFVVFGARTALRHASRVVMDDEGLRVEGPLRRAVAWRGVSHLRLRYFATRRDRSGGWMQLTLRGPGRGPGATLRLDSTLDGFPAIVRRAARAAGDNKLQLAPGTVDNLRAFIVTLDQQDPGAVRPE